MEQFVQAIVSGGLALVAGLWLTTLFEDALLSGLGWGLVVFGLGGLAWGIGQMIEW